MSSFFVDTYRRYKRYTNDIAQWLTNTTNLYEVPIRNVESTGTRAEGEQTPASISQGVVETGRSKGKPRKLARKAGNIPNRPLGPTTVHGLDVDDFLSLASGIAKSEKAKQCVTSRIIYKVRATIEMRTDVSKYYEARGSNNHDPQSFESSNSTHAHFISQLKEVLRTLRPLLVPESQLKPSQETQVAHAPEPKRDSNKFSGFLVERSRNPKRGSIPIKQQPMSTRTSSSKVV